MPVRQPVAFAFGALLIAGGLVFLVQTAMFTLTAEHAVGRITEMRRSNGHCGSKSRYPCTHFQAAVGYHTASGEAREAVLSAGSARGDNQPLGMASRRVGQQVPLLYDPDDPSEFMEDSSEGLWLAPTGLMGMGGFAIVLSFFKRIRRRWWWVRRP